MTDHRRVLEVIEDIAEDLVEDYPDVPNDRVLEDLDTIRRLAHVALDGEEDG